LSTSRRCEIYGEDERYKNYIPSPNIALLSLILLIGTCVLALSLKKLRHSVFFGSYVRRTLSDVGMLLSLVLMVLVDYLIQLKTGVITEVEFFFENFINSMILIVFNSFRNLIFLMDLHRLNRDSAGSYHPLVIILWIKPQYQYGSRLRLFFQLYSSLLFYFLKSNSPACCLVLDKENVKKELVSILIF
jgi:hypothetical protein